MEEQPIDDFKTRIREVLKTGRKADKEDRDRAELWEGMIKTKAWLSYMQLLNIRIEELGSLMMEPSGSQDGAMVSEFIKGTMRGLILARDLPGITVSAIAATAQPAGDEDVD